jgi:hypothetical protein
VHAVASADRQFAKSLQSIGHITQRAFSLGNGVALGFERTLIGGDAGNAVQGALGNGSALVGSSLARTTRLPEVRFSCKIGQAMTAGCMMLRTAVS